MSMSGPHFRVALVVCLLLGACTVAHAQSAVDGFNPGADNFVHVLVGQPDGKVLVGGDFTKLGGGATITRNRLGRLNHNGSPDGFDPGANDSVYTLALQPDGKVVVGGAFTMLGGGGTGTQARSFIGRLNADGSLDALNPGANCSVFAVALQADGKILVGGCFIVVGGGGFGTTPRQYLARLNADGTLDPTFTTGTNSWVRAIVVQPDGRILIAGDFTEVTDGGGPTLRYHIARLNPDGSLDNQFNPGANDTIWTLALQADGKVLAGGRFSGLGGVTGTVERRQIGRFHSDGALDQEFNPDASSSIPNTDVREIAVQADGKILMAGGFTELGRGVQAVTRIRIARLFPNGAIDMGFNPGASNIVLAMAIQPDGKIVVGGVFPGIGGGFNDTPRSYIGRIETDGTVDRDFDPGANLGVLALAIQPDGKVVAGGGFTTLGAGATTTRHRLARLNADGSVDASFNPGANNNVHAVAVQADGQILVGGNFTMLGGGTGTIQRPYFGRLTSDGFVDTAFDPGANDQVFAIAVQPNGKILVGGYFTQLGGGGFGFEPRSGLGRFNATGGLDFNFDPGANGRVLAIALQPDEKILVGGEFTMIGFGGTGSVPRNYIARLHPDGSLDEDFNPGASGPVHAIVVEPDGNILVGGAFTGLGGETGTTPRSRLGRLAPDGFVDPFFDPGPNNTVHTLALQTDGQVLVGGIFATLNLDGTGTKPATRRRLARVSLGGSLDGVYDAGANNAVYALAVAPDGKVLVGGEFTTLGGGGTGTTSRFRIGRLTNDLAAIQQLTVTSTGTATWSRNGASPEVSRVTFERSTDGVSYSLLTPGTRVPGGWQATSMLVATGQRIYVRARGDIGTGQYGASGTIVESVRQVRFGVPFTDDPLVAGVSTIRWYHITELRIRIDALRTRFGAGTFAWSGAITAGVTPVLAQHVAELRTALLQAYAYAGRPSPVFSDPVLFPTTMTIKRVHIKELRDAVQALELQ